MRHHLQRVVEVARRHYDIGRESGRRFDLRHRQQAVGEPCRLHPALPGRKRRQAYGRNQHCNDERG
jgi:hypothetical protein